MKMSTKICYLVHCHNDDEEYKDSEEKIMHEDVKETHHMHNDYTKYISKYGKHFTKELAEYAVKRMKPSSHISYDKVEETLAQSAENLAKENTIADLYFITNAIRKVHSSNTIKSDVFAISLGIEKLNNSIHDEVFIEWCEKMKRMGEEIPWKNFIEK